MTKAIENLVEAQNYAFCNCPKVGGFPYLAEVLRLAGVKRNVWHLPSCQSVYYTKLGEVVSQGTPLLEGFEEIPKFDKEALVNALGTDQAGNSTFMGFLNATWKAGIVSYEVDFEKRCVTYFGIDGDSYLEEYPKVTIEGRPNDS